MLALTAVARSLTDMIGTFVLDGFVDKKYVNDKELRIRMMLRNQLADTPTQPQINAFEQEQLEIYASRQKRARETRALAADKVKLRKQREFAEKYLGMKAGPVAVHFDAEADAPMESEAVEAVAEIQGRGGALRTAALHGALRDAAPRVASLVVSGQLLHGGIVTAQGFLENCRCVRFQWYASKDGKVFELIPGSTMPTFFATADDAKCYLKASGPETGRGAGDGRGGAGRGGQAAGWGGLGRGSPPE